MDIVKTLADRGSRYGTFAEQANVTGNIKRAMATGRNWANLSDDQKEALEMIALKCARILTGDPNFHDSWHDIVGYAKLVADRLAEPTAAETIGTRWTATELADHQSEHVPAWADDACQCAECRPPAAFPKPWEAGRSQMSAEQVERVASELPQAHRRDA